MDKHSFHAGAAKIDITPTLGTLINGDFVTHYARFIHDSLFAKAMVFKKGPTISAVIIVDTCLIPSDFADEVKSAIATDAGIIPENVLISSTHTHAGGSLEGVLLGAVDLSYRKKLFRLILDVVVSAKNELRPAKIAFGTADAPEHVVCRRYFMKEGYEAPNPVTGGKDQVKTNPSGDEHLIISPVAEMDTELGYLAVQGLDDKWIGLIGNYSMHYVGDWPVGTISSDYFGAFGNRIEEGLNAGPDFIAMLSNGTSGNANIWDFQQPDRYPAEYFMKGKLIGEDLAQKVLQSLENISWETEPTLDVNYSEPEIRLRKPTIYELEKAKELMIETDFEHLVPDADGLKRLFAREQVLLEEYPDSIYFPVQAIKIGTGTIGALAGEFFAETGLLLKRNYAPGKYFTISLANGSNGYVPPAHEIELGGYETWRCRTSCLHEDAEELIRKELIKNIGELS